MNRMKNDNPASDVLRILVICPDMEDLNPFISILINEIRSDKKYIVQWGVQSFWNMTEDYDIIHIHWIEMFLGWRLPSENDIRSLFTAIRRWKERGTKIVYNRHDEDSHYSKDKSITQKMYDFVMRASDAVIHLGEYSKRETIQALNLPHQINAIIPHHTYDTIYSNSIDRDTARDLIGIDKTGIVILTFGDYRNVEENMLVKEAFEQLAVENKFLLAPTWKNRDIIPSGNVFTGNLKVDEDMLPYCFAAADIVFIQRVKILNSGNLPMAFFFNKIVVGPDTGNVKEYLDEENNFSFDVNDLTTAVQALQKAVKRITDGTGIPNENFARDHWNTSRIVEQYKRLYQTLCMR